MTSLLKVAIGKGPRTQAKLAEIRKRQAEEAAAAKKASKKKGRR